MWRKEMREALIVWGGWSGHEPEQCAYILAKILESQSFKVYVENTTEAFADPGIVDMSLIVPIVTMSKIEKEEVENLTAAVRSGVGLATTTFTGEHAPWIKGVTMPVVWKRKHGEGRVFYSSLGHVSAEFNVPEMRTIIERGMLWAAR
jgi:type 1 glutamine amidotransferase